MGILATALLILMASLCSAEGQTTSSSPQQEPRGFYPSVSVTTDNRFQGISLSDRKPVPQVSLHWLLGARFYTGIWMAGVDFNDPGDTWLEFDVYVGRRFVVHETELRLEAMYNSFNERDAAFPYDFFQAKVFADHNFGKLSLGTSGALSPSGSYGSGVTWHMRGHGSYALTTWLSAGASVGRGLIEHRVDRTYWDIGVTTKWRGTSLDVRYKDTDLSVAECGFTAWCEPAVVTTLSFPAY